MPEALTKQDIDSKTDPSVSKQYDETTPMEQKFEDFYAIADKLKPVHRSMAIAKRSGPDFLFLSNAHSQKFKDLEQAAVVNLAFQNSSTQDWISVTGKATTASNSDPRIKEIWNRGASSWFGDLGDGVHDGSADDPRMSLIEVKPNYITYWQAKVGSLGFLKEVVGAQLTGGIPNAGDIREMHEQDIEQARKRDSALTK